MKKLKISHFHVAQNLGFAFQSAQNILIGKSPLSPKDKSPCGNSPQSQAQIIRAALGKDCQLDEANAEQLINQMLIQNSPASKKGFLNDAVLNRANIDLVQEIDGKNLVSEVLPVRGQINNAFLLSQELPIPTERDAGIPRVEALPGVAAGSGKVGHIQPTFQKSSTAISGISVVKPVFGYLAHLQWSQNDVSSELRFIINSGTVHFATLSPHDDDCRECWVFIPAVTTSAVEVDGEIVYATGSGSVPQIDFIVYTSGAAATALGGWKADYRPVYLTQEKLSMMVPMWNGRQFSRR